MTVRSPGTSLDVVDRHPFSLESARQAARRGDLGRWVADFLASPGSDNAALADDLRRRAPYWIGPVLVPLDELHRLAGPADHPVLVEVDEDDWRDDVEELKEEIEDGWEPPPLVATFRDDQLVLEDGNHRVESLRRAGGSEGWTVIGFADGEARDRFVVATAARD